MVETCFMFECFKMIVITRAPMTGMSEKEDTKVGVGEMERDIYFISFFNIKLIKEIKENEK